MIIPSRYQGESSHPRLMIEAFDNHDAVNNYILIARLPSLVRIKGSEVGGEEDTAGERSLKIILDSLQI